MEKVKIQTLGCKVNQYESQAIGQLFEDRGYRLTDEDFADIYIINTCTVTNLSDAKSRKLIRRFKRVNPDSIMLVMGCYSQVAKDELEDLDQVDIIVGTTGKDSIVDLVEEFKLENQRISKVDEFDRVEDFEDLDIDQMESKTRAFIKIQDGCNRYCSYCIIPYARGPIRSRDPKNTLDEIKRLADNGFKEVVLTGIHVASFGKDLDSYSLVDLIEDISKVDGIRRIRLSSVEPSLVDEEFLRRVSKIDQFCDHFHLSLQSGSDTVLKRMNRKYTTGEYEKIVENIRSYYPNCGITTDIIVGFPEESDEEFEETLEFVKKIKFSKVHVFKYSPRKGTKAAAIKAQVDGNIKNERSKILIDLTKNLEEDFLDQQIGQSLDILYERDLGGVSIGHSSNYLEVQTKSDRELENTIVKTAIIERESQTLLGKI